MKGGSLTISKDKIMLHSAQDGVSNGHCSIRLKGVKVGWTPLGGTLTIVAITHF